MAWSFINSCEWIGTNYYLVQKHISYRYRHSGQRRKILPKNQKGMMKFCAKPIV